MASESFERRVYVWIGGIVATIAVAGITANMAVLWNMNATLVSLASKNESMSSRIADLEQAVQAGTALRYSSSDAATDRASVMSLITAMTNRNIEQDRDINRLVEFKARVEERLKISPFP